MTMNWLRILAGLLLATAPLVMPLAARACPACTEMVVAAGEDDADNFPAAVNQSIYLMVSVPYLSVLVVGLLVYRGVKKNREYLDELNLNHGEHGATAVNPS